jgi:hypothetical protein
LIVAYLPEPDKHPLWTDIQRLLDPKQKFDPVDPTDELVWIAFDGTTLFGAGTTLLYDDHAEIRLCGGFNHREWVNEAEALVTRWAQKCGVPKLTMQGRKGWSRYFANCGWRVSSSDDDKFFYEKDLTGGQHEN